MDPVIGAMAIGVIGFLCGIFVGAYMASSGAGS